jgi:hypothetical protein
MIGMVLVTHGRLAEELRHAMEHVVGPQQAVATVCIGPEDDMEHTRADIRRSIDAVDQGDVGLGKGVYEGVEPVFIGEKGELLGRGLAALDHAGVVEIAQVAAGAKRL